MALSFIGGTSVSGTSITIPAGHEVGDEIFIFAFNSAAATAPVAPAGYGTLQAPVPANVCAGVLFQKFATSSAEVSGTFTNTTQLVCAVYRGTRGSATTGSATGSSNVLTFPAHAGTTIQNPSQDWFMLFGGHTVATNVNALAYTGWVARTSAVGNVGLTDSGKPTGVIFPGTTQTVSTTGGWVAIIMILRPSASSFNNTMALKGGNGLSFSERIR